MGADRRHDGGRRLIRDGVLFGADAIVTEWVRRRIPAYTPEPEARALGVVGDGDLVAGVVYEHFNGAHVQAAIAAEPGTAWAKRAVLRHLFGYPFHQLGCQAISVLVPATNLASLNLALKLGFEPEAFLKFAAPDASALVVLKQFRETCRWIEGDG